MRLLRLRIAAELLSKQSLTAELLRSQTQIWSCSGREVSRQRFLTLLLTKRVLQIFFLKGVGSPLPRAAIICKI